MHKDQQAQKAWESLASTLIVLSLIMLAIVLCDQLTGCLTIIP